MLHFLTKHTKITINTQLFTGGEDIFNITLAIFYHTDLGWPLFTLFQYRLMKKGYENLKKLIT